MWRLPSSLKEKIFLLGLVPLFFFFWGLGNYGLLNNNEGLYGEIAREMVTSGTLKGWIIPTLNGVPYLEKPPLLYWLTALSFWVFGISEWSARFVPACSGVMTVLGGMFFLKKIEKENLIFPFVMILSSCLGYVIFSRMLYFEGILTALLSFSFFSFYLWYTQKSQVWLRWTYIFLALSSLAKGFVGPCLFIVSMGIFLIWQRASFSEVKNFFEKKSFFLGSIIFLLWPLLAQFYEPSFFSFYVINEHVLRFLGMREPKDYYSGPFYYYLPRLLGYIAPWTPFLGLFLFKPSQKKEKYTALGRFLGSCILGPLIFYSLSRAKANYYMIVSIVPLIFLVAMSAQELIDQKRQKILYITGLLVGFLGCGLMGGIYYMKGALFGISCVFFWGLMGFFILGTLSFSRDILTQLTKGKSSFVYGAFVAGLILIFLLQGMKNLENMPLLTAKKVAVSLKDQASETVYFYRNFEEMSSLVFYLQHPVVMVDSVSADLFYASQDKKFQNKFQNSENISPTDRDYIVVLQKSDANFKASPLWGKSRLVFRNKEFSIYRGIERRKKV